MSPWNENGGRSCFSKVPRYYHKWACSYVFSRESPPMNSSTKQPSIWTECLLWGLSSTLLVGLVSFATYFAGGVLQWGMALTLMSAMIAGVLAVTWGSWGALIWAQRRAVRAGIESVTVIPGILILALGFVGLYLGVGKAYLWLSLILPSAGTVAVALLLSRQSNQIARAHRTAGPWRHILAWTLFPVLTMAIAGALGYLWFAYVTRPVNADWRSLFNMASFMVSVLGLALITTVIPAMTSRLCIELAARLDAQR
jgi:hypothetical protein